jgi:hypothetical protein
MATSKNIILPTLALMIVAGTATAQAADVDVNGDGMYSFPELQAAMPEVTEEMFVTLDVTGDGLLDATEIEAGVQAGFLPSSDG